MGLPMKRMLRLRESLQIEDLALISSQETRTQYNEVHKSYKRKGGFQSREIQAVQLWIDFYTAFDNEDYDEAVRSYYPLKRMIGA